MVGLVCTALYASGKRTQAQAPGGDIKRGRINNTVLIGPAAGVQRPVVS